MRIGYARVSTEDQKLALQIDALKTAGCQKIFQEKISSTHAQRPALSQLLEQVRAADTIVVWKLDRLGRSLHELISLVNQFDAQQVNLMSLHEHIDTTHPTGRMIFHIFCVLAEFERELIRERTLAGLAAARARKKVLGRPKGLSKRAIQKAKTAASLYRENTLSVSAICSSLAISAPTLYKYLRHEGIDPKSTSISHKSLPIVIDLEEGLTHESLSST